MMTNVKDRKFDEVLVWKVSRLSRKKIDLLKIVEKMNKNNVIFKSFSENFETETSMGRFALQMMGALGELERNTIIDNVKLGIAQRSREGYLTKRANTFSTASITEIISNPLYVGKIRFNRYENCNHK